MVDALSNKLTLMIKMNVKDVDNEKAEIINYGLKCFISSISKCIVIVLLSYFLGILDLVIISMISFCFYRTFAGGAHAKTHIACLLSSSAIFISSVYIAMYTSFYFGKTSKIYLLIFIINLIIIYLYAPADVKQKPILNKNFRKRMRVCSFLSMSLIIIFALAVINNNLISNLIVLTTLFQGITMLPIFYKILGCEYGYKRTSVNEVKPL